MNWTGGRLHRSSYKTKSSSKNVGRQRVAQAKIRMVDRPRDILSFKAATGATDKEGCYDGQAGTTQAVDDLGASFQKTKQPAYSNTEDLQSKNHCHSQITKSNLIDSPAVRIEEMRKKLLDKKDWAGLSLSRSHRSHTPCGQDKGTLGRRESLSYERCPSRYFPHRGPPSLPIKRRNIAQPHLYPENHLSSDDISVWIEQQQEEPQYEALYNEMYMEAQESVGPILSNNNKSRDRSIRSTKRNARSLCQSGMKTPRYAACSNRVDHEQYQLQLSKRLDTSPSSDLSNLPVLDRRGSFATIDGQTRYVPPSSYKPSSLSSPEEDSRMKSPKNADEYWSRRRAMLYHSQGYQAQDISPRNSKWREVAGNLNGCSLEYSWGDNTAMIRQREVTGGVKQSKIGGFSTSCSDEATFWRNTIPSPFRSDPSYRSYHPISSPQSNKKQHSVNRSLNRGRILLGHHRKQSLINALILQLPRQLFKTIGFLYSARNLIYRRNVLYNGNCRGKDSLDLLLTLSSVTGSIQVPYVRYVALSTYSLTNQIRQLSVPNVLGGSYLGVLFESYRRRGYKVPLVRGMRRHGGIKIAAFTRKTCIGSAISASSADGPAVDRIPARSSLRWMRWANSLERSSISWLFKKSSNTTAEPMSGMIISVVSSLSILASVVLSSPARPATGTLPLVIWHGLGDSYANDGMKSIARLAETTNPGTHVHLIRFGATGTEDRDATFFGNVTAQVDEVCQTLASDPVISNAPGINALGFSQGGQFLRAYTQRCNKPPVHNLVTFGSQHNGIASFTACKDSGDWLCWSFNALLRFGTWSSIAQSGLVPAQYFRDPEELENYLKYSNFLADINNERAVKNTKYRENLMKLNKFVMYMFKDDTTVIPKESAFFTEVNATSGEHTKLQDRPMYKEDWLGLKVLDEQSRLEFLTIPGRHMQLSEALLVQSFHRYFGPVEKSVAKYAGTPDFRVQE
ncbi:hypothetical protein H113_08050 [Trichophyton rubrum MR1459]|nr:hypothetical protein H113_08050 [Trichophyton rubrum MR1459]